MRKAIGELYNEKRIVKNKTKSVMRLAIYDYEKRIVNSEK